MVAFHRSLVLCTDGATFPTNSVVDTATPATAIATTVLVETTDPMVKPAVVAPVTTPDAEVAAAVSDATPCVAATPA